jgi:4-alpha-methyl-delta7-sterol-4alpha-methyl oxidase
MSWEAYQLPAFGWLVVGGTLVSMVSYLVFAIPLTWVAWAQPAWAAPYQVQERPADVGRWLGPGLASWAVNQAVTFAALAASWPLWAAWCPIRVGGAPGLGEVAWQLLLFAYLDDLLYYGMHRALHHPAVYRHVHLMHHRVRTPFALTGHYMHPVEYALTAALMLVGPMLVGAHVWTVYAWVTLRQLEAAEGHGGYHLPFSPLRLLPGNHGADFHDFHHSRLVGNYAGFFAWVDAALGTWSKGYAEHVRARGIGWWIGR